MSKQFSWKSLKLFQKGSSTPPCGLTTSAFTYTQVVTDKNGEGLDASRHGLNRDAVRVALLGSQVGVIAVADGCGLTYWSEIAAHIAVNEFILAIEKRLANEHPPYAPGVMRSVVREAIHTVNQSMLSWKHPKLKSKCNVLDKGGNTTLVVAIVFPYFDDETTTVNLDLQNGDDNAAPTDPLASSSASSTPREPLPSQQSKSMEIPPSPQAKTPSRKLSGGSRHPPEVERKFGVVFTGMGDSELYLFKVNEPERPMRGKGSSTSISSCSPASTSAPVLPAHSPGSSESHDLRSSAGIPSSSHSRVSTNDDMAPSSPSHRSLASKQGSAGDEPPTSTTKSKHAKLSSRDRKKSGKFLSALAGSPSSSSVTSSSPPSNVLPASPASASDTLATRNSITGAETQQPPTYTFIQARPVTHDSTSPIRSSNPSWGTNQSSSEPASPRTPIAEMGHQRGSSKDVESPMRMRLPSSDPSPDLSLPNSPKTTPVCNNQPLTSNSSVGTIAEEQCEEDSSPRAPESSSPTTAPEVADPNTTESKPISNLVKDLSNSSINGTDDAPKKAPRKKRGSSTSSRASEPQAVSGETLPADSTQETTLQTKRKRKSSRSSEGAKSPKKSSALAASSSSTATESFSSRPARYSKSFSDIPIFDSSEKETPSPMCRSESLTLDLSPARDPTVSQADDAPASFSASSRTVTPPRLGTPRTPCGTWLKILSDSGRSPFLPFPGLKDRSIPEPNFIALNPGDAVFACSDGVVSSYAEGIQWPEINIELYDANDGLEYATHALIQSTISHHKASQTDPDDVTIGSLKVTTYAKKPKSDSLRLAPVRDVTSTFAPQFASSTYHREYLNDFLCEYPKLKDKPPS